MPEFLDLIHWLQAHAILPVMAVFLVLLGWTYWPSHKAAIEAHGQIPLDDDQ